VTRRVDRPAGDGGAAAVAAGDEGLRDAWLKLPPRDRLRVLHGLSDAQARELLQRWSLWVHPGQAMPSGDWRVWLIRAGRGFGKTRAGSEWVSELARTHRNARIALVGATSDEVRRVMVEGTSGLIAVARDGETVDWRPTTGVVRFASGAIAYVYSAEAPEALRGPEHHFAWCDELGKWRQRGEAAWDNLMMGLRQGDRQRVLVTTTPRSTNLMRRVMAMPDCVETRGRTRDNPHLPETFVVAMETEYGGTRLGRQELDGELLEDVAGALWTRAMIERCCGGDVGAGEAVRVVVGVDPPVSAEGDACGIVAAAIDAEGVVTVLEDASVRGLSPDGWARAVAACAHRHGADKVVAEANQGGEMVETVLRAADVAMPVRRGHARPFPALEDELCGLVRGGDYVGPGRSPDRADALVWAVWELALGWKGEVGVRLPGGIG